MTKLAPEWVRTSDPVIRSPARYRWTRAPAPVFIEIVVNVIMPPNGDIHDNFLAVFCGARAVVQR